jgi:cell division protein FtsQ
VSTGTRPAPPPRRGTGAPAVVEAASPARGTSRATAGSRRRFRVLIAVAVVAVLALVAYGASISPFLDVDKIVVHGAQHTDVTQLEHAAGIAKGDPLFWASTGDAVRGLEAVPYVRQARVTKEWPDTVRITITERTPVAWVDGPAGHAMVDGTGRVLAVVAQPPAGFPKLLGVHAVPGPGGVIVPAGPARAAGALPPLAAAGTTSVTATDGGLTMQLAAGAEVRLGDTTQLRAKVRAAVAVLGAMGDQPVHYIDVSVPTNPVAG